MRQVVTDGHGRIRVREVDPPDLRPQTALTRTAFSLISTGTESMAVLGRRSAPDSAREDAPIGYSNSGTVLQPGPGMEHLAAGSRVGCYGSIYAPAGHAEMSLVAKHLCVPLPEHVTMRQAAFTGLGGIAVQAVRQARLSFGEIAAVVGLGVLGQLVARICSAAGYRVVATDLNRARVETAYRHGTCTASTPEEMAARLSEMSGGHGADAVLLCVAKDSSEPLRQALEWVRFHGRIVVVGVARLEIDRAQLFAKEADLTISRAAGPGRYEAGYERDGADIPYPLVRWTEGRNLQEFVRLVAERRLHLDDLITHEFEVDNAPAAFEQVLERPEETLGVLLRFGDPGA